MIGSRRWSGLRWESDWLKFGHRKTQAQTLAPPALPSAGKEVDLSYFSTMTLNGAKIGPSKIWVWA